MPVALRPLTLAALLATAATVAGCGASSAKDSASSFKGPQHDVVQAVENLQSDGQKKDAKAICKNLLTAELVQKIRAASGACDKALGDALDDTDVFELQVQRVLINGANAQAQVQSQA